MKIKALLFVFVTLLILGLTGCKKDEPAAAPPSNQAVINTQNAEIVLDMSFGERSGVYEGEFLDGLPYGFGSFTTKDKAGENCVYSANWEHGLLIGEGSIYYPDSKTTYSGVFSSDVINDGSVTVNDVLVYEGQLKDGLANGKGKLYSYDGSVFFDGAFENGFMLESTEKKDDRLGDFKNVSKELKRSAYRKLFTAVGDNMGTNIKVKGKVISEPEEKAYGGVKTSCFYVSQNSDAKTQYRCEYPLTKDGPRTSNDASVEIYGIFTGLYSSQNDDGSATDFPRLMIVDLSND